jgi:hypothetical protein
MLQCMPKSSVMLREATNKQIAALTLELYFLPMATAALTLDLIVLSRKSGTLIIDFGVLKQRTNMSIVSSYGNGASTASRKHHTRKFRVKQTLNKMDNVTFSG